MGNKYIIEIEEAYAPIQRIETKGELPLLYRVKGFNSLVFDKNGLNKLEKYDPNEEYNRGFERGCAYAETENMLHTDTENHGYEKGLNDAWEAAKKISCYPPDGFNMIRLREIFGKPDTGSIIKSFSATEVIAKIESYEEKQKAEIRVGDEVIVNGLTGVVMKLDEKGNVDRYFTCDGKTFGNISGFQNNEVKKTGRHFPEVAELLEKMEVEE